MENVRPSFLSKLRRHLRRTVVAGILILVPLLVTYLLLRMAFEFIDGVLQPQIASWTGVDVPGIGLGAIVVLLYLIGLLWTRRLGRRLIRTGQHYLLNIPIVGAVYSPARKLIESFSGDGVSGFKRVVLVEYPKSDTWMIGFLTGITSVRPLSVMGIVYLPTAPTPNSGWVALVPIQKVYDTPLTIKEAMSLILSGGIASPLEMELKPLDVKEVDTFLETGGVRKPTSPESGVFQLPFRRRPQ